MSKIQILPNLCTAANLLLGVAALAAVMNQNFQLSVVLILLAAAFDRLDGILARRYNAASSFGKEFDSLSDLVSFGVAPASLLYRSLGWHLHIASLACFALFILCGAFRLARFNILNDPSHFLGVPITVAGSILAVAIFFIPNPIFIVALAVLLSLAMISTIRIPKI
mgnify:CR=1 FL=1